VSGRRRDRATPFPPRRASAIYARPRVSSRSRAPRSRVTRFFSLDEDLPPTTHRAPRSRCVFSPHLSAGATTT
jgi:hypothetical protein